MLKKTITFDDVDGNKITEDFYFNLSKAELSELEIGRNGFAEYLQRIVDANSGRDIIDTFKEILTMSVGKRSADGRRFIKNQEVREDFLYSDAYSVLFMELITDPESAAAFVRGVVPKDLADSVEKQTTTVELPDKDFAAKPVEDHPLAELPESGRIDKVEGEVVTGAEPRPFPTALAEATEANVRDEDNRPAWMKENREPTERELTAMSQAELRTAFRMKAEGKFNN